MHAPIIAFCSYHLLYAVVEPAVLQAARQWLYTRNLSCHWYCLLLQRGPTSRMASAHCSFSRLVACRAALVADVAHYLQQEVTIEGQG